MEKAVFELNDGLKFCGNLAGTEGCISGRFTSFSSLLEEEDGTAAEDITLEFELDRTETELEEEVDTEWSCANDKLDVPPIKGGLGNTR